MNKEEERKDKKEEQREEQQKERMCKWFASYLPCPHWDKYGKCKYMHNIYIRDQ